MVAMLHGSNIETVLHAITFHGRCWCTMYSPRMVLPGLLDASMVSEVIQKIIGTKQNVIGYVLALLKIFTPYQLSDTSSGEEQSISFSPCPLRDEMCPYPYNFRAHGDATANTPLFKHHLPPPPAAITIAGTCRRQSAPPGKAAPAPCPPL